MDQHGIAAPLATEFDIDALQALASRLEAAGPRYTSYPTVPVWDPGFSQADHRAAIASSPAAEGLSVYVHVPFCRSLCHFCACNRIITQDPELPKRFLSSIGTEIESTLRNTAAAPKTAQMHWGGGTPTHLDPRQLETLFRSVTDSFPLADGAEISIEVDPRVTHPDQIATLADCGFNRISLGVQDTNPKTQKAIARIQPTAVTRRVIEEARKVGIHHVNVDLIYGLPHQTESSFRKTIDEVLELRPDRLALYGYAHVTWVAKQQRGFERMDLPEPSRRLQIQLQSIQQLIDAGYRFIGMDHFALPDDELSHAYDDGSLRRNFMGYTTRDGLETLGFGPSAISELHDSYVQSVKDLRIWSSIVDRGELATERGHVLTADDRARRWMIRQIMCQGRLDSEEVGQRFGTSARNAFAGTLPSLDALQREGVVDVTGDRSLEVTPVGRLFVRNVAMAFDAYLGNEVGADEAPKRFSQTV